MLRQEQYANLRLLVAGLSCRVGPVRVVVGRHAYVDHHEVEMVLGDRIQHTAGGADTWDDLGVLGSPA